MELCCIAGKRMMSRAGDENDKEAAAAPATVVKEAAAAAAAAAPTPSKIGKLTENRKQRRAGGREGNNRTYICIPIDLRSKLIKNVM